MLKHNLFLIKADNDEECITRLPVNKSDGITAKGFKIIRERFSTPEASHGLKYALNLEAYSNAESLMVALKNYQKNIL